MEIYLNEIHRQNILKEKKLQEEEKIILQKEIKNAKKLEEIFKNSTISKYWLEFDRYIDNIKEYLISNNIEYIDIKYDKNLWIEENEYIVLRNNNNNIKRLFHQQDKYIIEWTWTKLCIVKNK